MDQLSWSNYWQGSAEAGAFSVGGVNHPTVDDFWRRFALEKPFLMAREVLELAAGNGVVTQNLSANANSGKTFFATDFSQPALVELKKRVPGVRCFVSDLAAPAIKINQFDMVVSQYGIEYAGLEAIFGVESLLSPSATLALVMHSQGSEIFLDSERSLAVLEVFERSGFMALSKELFHVCARILQTGNQGGYQEAAGSLAGAIKHLDQYLQSQAASSAGKAIKKIIDDVVNMHARLEHYDVSETILWLERMAEELMPYQQRLKSMMTAALTPEAFSRCCDFFSNKGFKIAVAEFLSDEQGGVIGYQLIASR